MKVSLVLVGYHSSPRLVDCIRSFCREARTTGVESEIIIVDHSESREEARRLQEFEVDRLIFQTNRGYAAGLNAGVSASQGDILFLANPDIFFQAVSVARLLKALEAGFSIVGPQLYWDRKAEILLPPPDDPAPLQDLHRRLRAASPIYWMRTLSKVLDRIHELWSIGAPVEVPSLRGPLLVMRRADWEKYGPMDEGYFLYFEETEFLLRARRRGACLGLVRDAGLVHEWGHATRDSAEAAAQEQASRIRFYRRNYPFGGRVLELIRPEAVFVSRKFSSEPGGMEAMRTSGGDLCLFSPFDHLHPAAGWLGKGPWPEGVSRLFGEGRWRGLSVSGSPGNWVLHGPWTWGES